MVRVLRYPRLSAFAIGCVFVCAIARDVCVGQGLDGWARVLLVATFALLGLCGLLMSCRFFLDQKGVGVGFLLRVRRTPWHELASLGVLSCNSRRAYLYGLYRGSGDFLQMLHRAPQCGNWGFVVPTSRRLVSAIITLCPEEIDFSPEPVHRPALRLRPLWHQAALYLMMMIPASLLAFLTGGLMLVRASALSSPLTLTGLTLLAMALFAAGLILLYRAGVSVMTCPRINEEGVCAGAGTYMAWDDVRFGYVHRMAQVSGMFLLSQPLEEAGKRGAPPIRCLSMPDTSTLLLAYLTYCPHARKGMEG